MGSPGTAEYGRGADVSPFGGLSPGWGLEFGPAYRTTRVAQLFRRHAEAISRVAKILDLRRPVVSHTLDCPPPRELALDTVATLAALNEVVTSHTTELVAIARAAGATWNEIGDALGISKQAAHERYRKVPQRYSNRAAAR